MKYYLGLGGSKHDYATCLIAGNEIVVAVEEERLTRKKRGFGIPEDRALTGVRECLDAAGITLADVDAVLVNDLLEPWCYEPLRMDVNIVGHHLTHAASAYYFSGFESAAVLVADHSGGRWRAPDGSVVAEVTSYYRGTGNDLELVDRVTCADVEPAAEATGLPFSGDLRGSIGTDLLKRPEHSLGRFYARLAKIAECVSLMGDGELHTESGKLMGLSAHGGTDLLEPLRECYRLGENGAVEFGRNRAGQTFEELARDYMRAEGGKDRFERRGDIAYAAQKCLEEMILHCARYARELTGETAVTLAGGIFLNGLANEAILKEGCFDRLFVQPAAHDAGTAIGAAVLGAVRDGQWTRPATPFSPLLGRQHSTEEIAATLTALGVPHRRVSDPERVVARAVADGKVIARYTGRCEFGPRALGNRSILADPRNPAVRKILDEKIKYREPFRPYAPAVRAEDASRFFELSGPSPHMLLIGHAKAEAERVIPAVVHIDGTVRAQEVGESDNPSFYRLLGRFAELTGVPVLLNTSMNVQGEPIVESPTDAVNFLYSCLVDSLVIENFVCARSEHQLRALIDSYDARADAA